MTQREQIAYELGVLDRKNGLDWEDCPFDEDDELCLIWENGFNSEDEG